MYFYTVLYTMNELSFSSIIQGRHQKIKTLKHQRRNTKPDRKICLQMNLLQFQLVAACGGC